MMEGMVPEYDRKGKVRYPQQYLPFKSFIIDPRSGALRDLLSPALYRRMLTLAYLPLHRPSPLLMW